MISPVSGIVAGQWMVKVFLRSINKVRDHLKKWGRSDDVMEHDTPSATVELAALALGVEPARIAKCLMPMLGERRWTSGTNHLSPCPYAC